MAFRTTRSFAFSAAMVAAAIGFGIHPGAAKTIKLVSVGGSPPTVTPVKVTKDYIIPEINKRLAASGADITIDWTQAYAQSLAKFTEVLETVEQNIAQLGVQLVIFEESKLPLEQYGKVVPFGVKKELVAARIDEALRKQVPEMNATWRKYGQVHLASAGSAPMDIFTTFPVEKIDDLKGHKIGASGSMGQFLRGIGAVVVNSSMADSYTSIRNGVYEGYVISIGLAVPYRTYEAAHDYTQVDFNSSVTAELTFNQDAWKGLPDVVRKIIREVTANYGTKYAEMEKGRYEKFVKVLHQHDVHFGKLSDEERGKWARTMPNVPLQWAHRLDDDGLPGTKLLTAYLDEMQKHGANPLRNWVKEE